MATQRDILEELHTGRSAVADIYALADATPPSEISSRWGLTNAEWTAYAQGAGWADLARWRYTGWPSTCAVCGKHLPKPKEFGWFVVESSEGLAGLRHIGCQSKEAADHD